MPTPNVNVSPLRFLSPDEVDQWLASSTARWVARLEHGSMSLLEHLTCDVTGADDPAFTRAAGQTRTFLNQLTNALQSSDDLITPKLAAVFGILTLYLVEAGPYRFETKGDALRGLLDGYRALRLETIAVGKAFFALGVFNPIRDAINREIIPMLEASCEEVYEQDNRYYPFRQLQVANLAEQLRLLTIRLDPSNHAGLLKLLAAMYDMKYVRFGTSGYRGVFERDFTEEKVRITAQAICDFLKLQNMPDYFGDGEDLSGKVIVIGYDGRRTSPQVGRWVAEVALANGFKVYYASRHTPTPVLNFFAREYIGRDRLAGLINCTASHNPPEWQGIKFNPKEGYPAPSNLTNLIGYRCSMRQLLDVKIPAYDTVRAEHEGLFQQFDPMNLYLDWIKQSGKGNQRISINLDNIKRYFAGKVVVLDPMYGSGRGYLTKLLGELGVPHISIHDERDEDMGRQVEVIRGVPHLEYANPEPDFIQPLKDKVAASGAALGLGLDTDADRFGAVDQGGVYIRPNQILAMLTRYLGVHRGEHGRVIITQTGLPMIDAIAGEIEGNEAYRPPAGAIPDYIAHPFYHRRVGSGAEVNYPNTYVVPVSIKYIVDVSRVAEGVTDPAKAYRAQPDSEMPANWMDRMLIGGEESSGLTTRGHVPDKDGIWANLLIMDMLAYYGLQKGQTSLLEIWNETTTEMDWPTSGDRADIDAAAEAKEGILNYYLDLHYGWQMGDPLPEMCGLQAYYWGGTRYDMAEIFLQDEAYGRKHFLRVRASGTEPILRVYVESAVQEIADLLLSEVLDRLDIINADVIKDAYSLDRLADLLANTRFDQRALDATKQILADQGWDTPALLALLEKRRPFVEGRNEKLIVQWTGALG